MYSVYYICVDSDEARLFIDCVPDANLAARIADLVMDDFSEVVDLAWAEKD